MGASLSAWLQGLLVGTAATVAGVLALRVLVRRQVPWWPSVAAPLRLFGPAVGLIVGAWAAGAPLAFWDPGATWSTKIGWGILVFFGATAVIGLVRSFLQSRIVTEELALRIPALLL